MKNPFEILEARLSTIENLLLDLKHEPLIHYKDDKLDLLTAQEAADFLHLSLPTVYSKVSKGELPFMKRSKRLYFTKEELISYVKKGSKKSVEQFAEEVHTYLKK